LPRIEAARLQAAAQRWTILCALAGTMCATLSASPAPAKSACGGCHPIESQLQPKTPMGAAIELPGNQRLLEAHPHLTIESNGYTYRIERQNGSSTYTVKDSSGALTLPVRYAFGANNQTFVLEYQGRFYESLMSYYQSIDGLAPTAGDERIRPHSLLEAMGRPLAIEEITTCFGCHGTGGVTNGKLTLESLEPGITCVHCHQGVEAHSAAMTAGKKAPVPRKLGEMAAEDMSNFCGQCHRTWEAVISQHLFGEVNVRFQPYRLANSKCFLGDDKRNRCTDCHNPHAELARVDGAYDHVCLSCHRPSQGQTLVAGATQKPCTAGAKNCVDCHMPKVQQGEITYTDHYIRVVHTGDPYPN